MAIQILFDSANNVKSPTMVLTYRSGKSIGAILPHNLHYSESLNACNEMSFDVYKDINGVECQYWSNIKDFRLVYCVEWDEYFEIYVEIDEADETIKHIQGRSLSEAELSQIKVYGLEVNTELDISREDYRPTIIYSSDEEISLIHKLLEKTPNFEIEHVDISIAKLQRTFTFDDKTVYDALQEVSEEVKCLIEFKSKKGSDGKIKRSISIYDLSSFCEECGHRNIDGDVCPKYEDQESAHAVYKGKNINPGFGEDTSIFVSRKKLTDNITYSSDVDSVKNCFKLTAGDDLMTATVRNCSPSKSGYLWHFTQEMMSDMSSELRAIIGQYQAAYDQYNTQFKDGDIDYGTEWESVLLRYNTVCNKYKPEYSCSNKFTNYLDIMNTYYNTIDLELYLRSSMMPSVDLEDLTNKDQAATHISTISGSHTVYLQNITNLSEYSAKNAIESYLRTVVDPKFQIKLTQSSFANNIWNGVLTLVSYSNDNDVGVKNIIVSFSSNESGYTKQRLETSLAKTKAETPDIIELYSIGSDAIEEAQKFDSFKTEIGKYGLVPLTRLRDAGQACLNILIEMGVGGDKANTLWLLNWKDENNDLYGSLYIPYYNRVTELNQEIKERQKEIDDVVGKFDTNGHLVEHGMMSYLEDIVSELQEKLDLEGYINTFGGSNATELLKELVSFRREDTYKNDNFISEGLDNAQVFSRALEFVAEADKDIRAAAVPIHTISSTLKNLLVMKEFKGIVDKFKVGNWIRAEIDSEIFKLRLIRYDIGFDDINNIQVEFSDVQSVKDSMADIQSILNQASSIAGNYSNIKIEVDNNKKAGDYVWEWVNDGLALTKMKIVDDAENQNIYWDENGFLCREYSPVMDAYEDKQLKIINKGLYLTDDNWMTTRAGIGNFIYYDPKESATRGESVYKESYGVIADTLVGNLILSKEIGIYNEGNSIQMDSNGFIMTINPEDKSGYNVFTIQKKTDETDDDGNIKYDKLFNIDDDGNLCIKGHIYATSIELGSGVTNEDLGIDLSGLLSKSDASTMYVTQTGYNTKVTEIEQAIANIQGGNNSYIEQIGQIADNVVFFATAYGDTTGGYYANNKFWNKLEGATYSDPIEPEEDKYYIDIRTGKGYQYKNGSYSQVGIPGKTFAVNKNGSLIATDAVIKGTIYATDGEFFGNMKSGLKATTYGNFYNFDVTAGVVKMGYLGYENGVPRYAMTVNSDGSIVFDPSVNVTFGGSGSGSESSGGDSGSSYTLPEELEFLKGFVSTSFGNNYVFSPNISGGYLKIGSGTTSAEISSAGVLTATGANITGDLTANSLTIANNATINGILTNSSSTLFKSEWNLTSGDMTFNSVTTQISISDGETYSITNSTGHEVSAANIKVSHTPTTTSPTDIYVLGGGAIQFYDSTWVSAWMTYALQLGLGYAATKPEERFFTRIDKQIVSTQTVKCKSLCLQEEKNGSIVEYNLLDYISGLDSRVSALELTSGTHTHNLQTYISKQPTCGESGIEVTYCASSNCPDSYSTESIIPATGAHVDNNNDGYCDICGQRSDNKTRYTITTSVTGNGKILINGEVVSGTKSYVELTEITIVAQADTGYKFTQYVLNGTRYNAAGNTIKTGYIDSNIIVHADFESDGGSGESTKQYTITVQANPTAGGQVGGAGTFDYEATTMIVAQPNEGYTFTGWNDGNTSSWRTITVTGNKTYIANFTWTGTDSGSGSDSTTSHTIETEVSPTGSGTVTGGGTYNDGASVTLNAEPFGGYTFSHWNLTMDGSTIENVSSENPYNVTAGDDAKFTAVFNGSGSGSGGSTLSTTVECQASRGKIQVIQNGTILGESSNATYNLEIGKSVTLNAKCDGYDLVQWLDYGNTYDVLHEGKSYTYTVKSDSPSYLYVTISN